MTARQIFDAVGIELNKIQAPTLKLQEFNYLFNKAINQYINKVYNVYDINQQTTDDLRVLKSTAYLEPVKFEHNTSNDYSATHNENRNASSYLSRHHKSIQSIHGATYEVAMPVDYLHLLNCICIYYVAKTKDCWDAGSYIEVPATKLTADSWSTIITDVYNRPSPMRPYYYIHNQNNSTNNNSLPTDPITKVSPELGMPDGTDMTGTYEVTENGLTLYKVQDRWYTVYAGHTYEVGNVTIGDNGNIITTYTTSIPLIWGELRGNPTVLTASFDLKNADQTVMYYPDPASTVGTTSSPGKSNFPRTFKLSYGDTNTNVSLVEKPTAFRAGNTSNVRMEIRYGKDDSIFQLVEVQVDYVKCPQFIRLTQEQIDLTEDTSQIMEFPDYVNQEIINELVHLCMERANDPRLGNNLQITQSIARQGSQQAPAGPGRPRSSE